MSLSRNVTGREFQRHGPATEKLLSPRRVRVVLVAHVKTSADHSDRRPMSVKSWQSLDRYCGSWPCNAVYTRTASLKSMHCRTGNQCSSLRTGVICSRLPPPIQWNDVTTVYSVWPNPPTELLADDMGSSLSNPVADAGPLDDEEDRGCRSPGRITLHKASLRRKRPLTFKNWCKICHIGTEISVHICTR